MVFHPWTSYGDALVDAAVSQGRPGMVRQEHIASIVGPHQLQAVQLPLSVLRELAQSPAGSGPCAGRGAVEIVLLARWPRFRVGLKLVSSWFRLGFALVSSWFRVGFA